MNKIDEQSNKKGYMPGDGVDSSPPVTLSAPDSSGAAASRRVWLRRGLMAASPVVSSLVSMPVHAATACVLPSGFQSAATLRSRNPNAMVCTNQGPNFWAMSNLVSWPTGTTTVIGGTRTAIKLKDAFSVDPNAESGLTNPTLKEVLSSGSLLGKYAVAAYLNAKQPLLNFPLTESQAIAVYKSYRPGPVTAPLVLTWNEGQAIEWLQILMSP